MTLKNWHFLPLFLSVRYCEALAYLVYAYQSNETLLSKGPNRGVDEALIALYRRKCLVVGIRGNAAPP